MISGLSEDLNIIQKLDTLPNAEGGLTAEDLKKKFDESGLVIQEFINKVIIPAINDGKKATEEEIDSIREALQALDDDIAESVVNLTHAKITVTKTGDAYTANMTYEEVSTALAEGRTLYCSCGGLRLPYLRSITAGPHVFACIDGTNSYFVQILPSEVLFDHKILATQEEIPATLPNPSKLVFTGAVEAEYDGSSPLVIPIPEGGADPRYFSITEAGVVSLKPDYRGSGKTSYPESVGNGTQAALPEKLVIPDTIDGIQVTALAPGMFYGNTRVKEVTIPDAVTAIPESFAMYAINLRTVNNTENVTSIGSKAFAATRVKQAFFPNLTEMGTMVFALDGYLETVDIGKVTAIPERAFADCAFLERVLGGENVTSIGPLAFYHTHKLRDLPLLAHVTSVADYAFFFSRICTSLPAGGEIGTKAFPTVDNTTDFWTGVPYTPCQNRLTTKLSQANPEWVRETFLKDDNRGYGAGCALFCVMHIHSAITGKYYSDPREFVAELDDSDELEPFLYYNNWPGLFINVSKMFDALKYRTEVHGLADGDNLTAADYKALVDALAAGAYVYSQAGSYDEWQENDYFDGGHSVVLYGINELGEVCVLDSAIRHEPFRESGFEPDADVYTYTMPYQNLVGASSNFVIVYPKNVEPGNDVVTDEQVEAAVNKYLDANPVEVGDVVRPPATASVGQTIVVKAVDENGKPTEWESADMASGGRTPTLLTTFELAEGEEVNSITIDACDDGTTFADAGWRKIGVRLTTQGASDLTDYQNIIILVNGNHAANGYGVLAKALYTSQRRCYFTIEAQGCAIEMSYKAGYAHFSQGAAISTTHDIISISSTTSTVYDKITKIQLYNNSFVMLYGTKIEVWGIE